MTPSTAAPSEAASLREWLEWAGKRFAGVPRPSIVEHVLAEGMQRQAEIDAEARAEAAEPLERAAQVVSGELPVVDVEALAQRTIREHSEPHDDCVAPVAHRIIEIVRAAPAPSAEAAGLREALKAFVAMSSTLDDFDKMPVRVRSQIDGLVSQARRALAADRERQPVPDGHPVLDVPALQIAIHRAVCDRPAGYAMHEAGHGIRCQLSMPESIAAEYRRLTDDEAR